MNGTDRELMNGGITVHLKGIGSSIRLEYKALGFYPAASREKRLETYRIFPHGFWARILGRFAWQLLFTLVIQTATLVLYYPITIIPAFIRPLSQAFPHTCAFRALRLILLQGAAIDVVGSDLLVPATYAPVAVAAGFLLLRTALARAEGGKRCERRGVGSGDGHPVSRRRYAMRFSAAPTAERSALSMELPPM